MINACFNLINNNLTLKVRNPISGFFDFTKLLDLAVLDHELLFTDLILVTTKISTLSSLPLLLSTASIALPSLIDTNFIILPSLINTN